jgi:4-diphosphocytidyl-2-C-methyl-D-erythritol kinase
MIAFANAKINLGLLLTDKREDGYHNLQTVFYPVRIHDVVELVDATETTLQIRGLSVPGAIDDNLCLKVYRTLQADFNLPPQQIVLLKNIPVGAGLGGGSADVAFLLKLVNQKFELKLSDDTLQNYARKFGSDCAFFIENKACFAHGKGDEFMPIVTPPLANKFLVVVKPPIHVSTQQAYQHVKVSTPKVDLKEIAAMPLNTWKGHVVNDFEPSVFRQYPQIAEIKKQLYQAGATFALMSGSGSAVFSIFEHPIKLPELEKNNAVFYDV